MFDENGLPIYASGSNYAGDITVEDVKKDRDERLQLFMGAPSDMMRFENKRIMRFLRF